MTIKEFKNKFNEIYKDKFILYYFIWTYGTKENKIELFINKLNNHQYFKLLSNNNENEFIDEKDFEMLCDSLINLFNDPLFKDSDKNE